jgi:putative flippase GtrA
VARRRPAVVVPDGQPTITEGYTKLPDDADTAPARPLTPELMLRAAQFLRFGVVGAIGFVVDTAVVYGLRGWLGLYLAGIVSYVVAASVNFVLNRAWTFRGQGSAPPHRQWALFLLTNLGGFVLNRGTYAGLIFFSPLVHRHPVLAIAAGALAGMFLNFHLSRTVAFR